jgi:predicted DNA-binding transcriptional regulator AlpA
MLKIQGVPKWLTDAQLADRFGVTVPTVWRWHAKDPTFPRAVKLSTGTTRWKLSEIEAWEKSRAVAA